MNLPNKLAILVYKKSPVGKPGTGLSAPVFIGRLTCFGDNLFKRGKGIAPVLSLNTEKIDERVKALIEREGVAGEFYWIVEDVFFETKIVAKKKDSWEYS